MIEVTVGLSSWSIGYDKFSSTSRLLFSSIEISTFSSLIFLSDSILQSPSTLLSLSFSISLDFLHSYKISAELSTNAFTQPTLDASRHESPPIPMSLKI